jgi:hypothetical protein
VLPAVAKIVEVQKRLRADILEHVGEAGLARIERAITPVGSSCLGGSIFFFH